MKRACLVCAALFLAAPAAAQELHVVAGDAVTRGQASHARGYEAFPVTLLIPLGGEIHPERQGVRIMLFGDTLRFRSGYADFRVNRAAIPLHKWSFEADGAIHLPVRFFTDWLPSRYPDRLEFADGTLRLREVAITATPANRQLPAPAADVVPAPAPAPASGSTAPPPPPAVERRASTRPRAAEPTPAATAAKPARVEEEADPEAGPPSSLIGFIDSRVSGVSDSNIDHEDVPRAATGTVAAVAVGIQSSRSSPFLSARYDFRYYRFASSERWNRSTHEVRAAIAPSLRPFRFRLEGAVRVGSFTEDRELADQVVLRPSVELRASRQVFLTVHGAQRVRQVTVGGAERADTNRMVGIELARRWSGGGRWELESRYEDNGSQRPTSRYSNWSGRGMLRLPLTAADRLSLQVAYRERQYRERPVGTGDDLAHRHDRRWTPSGELTHDFGSGQWVASLDYELELNRSTEAGAGYQAHRFALTLRRRW